MYEKYKCPFCEVKALERKAKKEKFQITRLEAIGISILRHRKEEKPDPRTHFVAWYPASLLDRCHCKEEKQIRKEREAARKEKDDGRQEKIEDRKKLEAKSKEEG